MIQRKQTLFLLLLVFAGIALLFVSVATVTINGSSFELCLVPLVSASTIIQSTIGHLTAIVLNFIGLILAFLTILIYSKRQLQIKMCYALMLIWLIIDLMIIFCPFVKEVKGMTVQINYLSSVIGAIGVIGAYLASRFIKKDIELLKSADRIR